MIRKHARVCFYFNAVVSIQQRIQSFTCNFKIVFNYESEVGVTWQGFSAAVEFVHLVSFSTVHIYFRKKLDTRQDCHLLCNFVCIWPLKLNNKLGKITPYDTPYVGGFG